MKKKLIQTSIFPLILLVHLAFKCGLSENFTIEVMSETTIESAITEATSLQTDAPLFVCLD